MLYLEETLNLMPPSPETLDTFVELAQEQLVPVCQRLGSNLVLAWYSDVESFCQVTQILEFENLEALKAFRVKASQDRAWGEYAARLEELAPERRSRLLEPLGPYPPEILHEAAAESQQSPLGVYTLAILEVAPGKMAEFIEALTAGAKNRPTRIVASWRPIAGSPNEVIDVWKGGLRQSAYQPADEDRKQFFRRLRPRAPKERLIPVFTLPYSQLR